MVNILIISLWTIGYCCCFWEGMIFEKIGDWLDKRLPEYIQKPLYACFICACFWYGTVIYLIFMADYSLHFNEIVGQWFITVIPAMGLNAALSRIFHPS